LSKPFPIGIERDRFSERLFRADDIALTPLNLPTMDVNVRVPAVRRQEAFDNGPGLVETALHPEGGGKPVVKARQVGAQSDRHAQGPFRMHAVGPDEQDLADAPVKVGILAPDAA
jgi:hypothetical protein